jgi:hypothetical protein
MTTIEEEFPIEGIPEDKGTVDFTISPDLSNEECLALADALEKLAGGAYVRLGDFSSGGVGEATDADLYASVLNDIAAAFRIRAE